MRNTLREEWASAAERDRGLYEVVMNLSRAMRETLGVNEAPELLAESIALDFEHIVYKGMVKAWTGAVGDIEDAKLRRETNAPMLLRAHRIIQLKVKDEEEVVNREFYGQERKENMAAFKAKKPKLQALLKE